MDREKRKKWKQQARQSVKRHYAGFVLICLMLGLFGIAYSNSLKSVTTAARVGAATVETAKLPTLDELQAIDQPKENAIESALQSILHGNRTAGEQKSDAELKKDTVKDSRFGALEIGHSRGVLSQIVNSVSSGEIVFKIYDAIGNIIHGENKQLPVFIIFGLLVYAFVYFWIFNVIGVIYKRFFMEGRLYEHLPARRFLLFGYTGTWGNVALTRVKQGIYLFLWSLTVVGLVIKRYAYHLVPYILCENPAIPSGEVITLSRRMMDGHKWQLFKLRLSFIGWDILDSFTLGLSGLFYSNPYKEATLAEFYAEVRQQAKEQQIPGSELLKDEFLYETAARPALEAAYADVLNRPALPERPTRYKNPVLQFLSANFGLVLRRDAVAEACDEKIQREEQDARFTRILHGQEYPERLFIVPVSEKSARQANVSYLRHYSLTSMILLFFTCCFIGWSWEVSLHLIADGVFVNRGVLHGPWLPIYGFGTVLILLVLYRLRKNPVVEFFAAVVLCGIVEYNTAWYLETTHGGMKWWDYSGYFLNINGRVCAEGLLVFGLGGVAIVYLLAPMLDNNFRRIPPKIAVTICAVLLCLYTADQIYSHDHPNEGDGITSVSMLSDTDNSELLSAVLDREA